MTIIFSMYNKKKGDKMNEDQIILNEMEQHTDAIEKVRKEYLIKRNGKDDPNLFISIVQKISKETNQKLDIVDTYNTAFAIN